MKMGIRNAYKNFIGSKLLRHDDKLVGALEGWLSIGINYKQHNLIT